MPDFNKARLTQMYDRLNRIITNQVFPVLSKRVQLDSEDDMWPILHKIEWHFFPPQNEAQGETRAAYQDTPPAIFLNAKLWDESTDFMLGMDIVHELEHHFQEMFGADRAPQSEDMPEQEYLELPEEMGAYAEQLRALMEQGKTREEMLEQTPPKFRKHFDWLMDIAEDKHPSSVLASRTIEADLAAKIPHLAPQLQKAFPTWPVETAEYKVEQINLEMDPTGNQAVYTPWLVRMVVKQKSIPADGMVDIVKEDLAVFDQAKKVKGFPPDKKDINSIKSYEDLHILVDEVGELEGVKTKKKRLAEEGQKVIYDENKMQVIKISTPEAASKLCREDAWCIKDPGYSEDYLQKGPLYLVREYGDNMLMVHPASNEVQDANQNRPAMGAGDYADRDEYSQYWGLPVVGPVIQNVAEDNIAEDENEDNEAEQEREPEDLDEDEKIEAYISGQHTAEELQLGEDAAVAVLLEKLSREVNMQLRRRDAAPDFPWWDTPFFMDELTKSMMDTEADMLSIIEDQAAPEVDSDVLDSLFVYWKKKHGVGQAQSTQVHEDLQVSQGPEPLLPGPEMGAAYQAYQEPEIPRWPELEKILIYDTYSPYGAADYAMNILKHRWPQAEPMIFGGDEMGGAGGQAQMDAQNEYVQTFGQGQNYFSAKPAGGWTETSQEREDKETADEDEIDDFYSGDLSYLDEPMPEYGNNGKLSEPWLARPIQFGQAYQLQGDPRAQVTAEKDHYVFPGKGTFVTPVRMDEERPGYVVVETMQGVEDVPAGTEISVSQQVLTDDNNAVVATPEIPSGVGEVTEMDPEQEAAVTAMLKVADLNSKMPHLVKQMKGSLAIEDEGLRQNENFIEARIRTLNRDADPTGDMATYTPWLVRMVVKQQFWPSDSTLEAVTSSLEVFDLAKKVKGFPPDKKDINSIKSFDDLEALANEVKDLEGVESKKKRLAREGQKVIHDEKGVKVIEITTVEAGAELCRGEEWCIKDPSYSEGYLSDGPVYLVMNGEEKILMASPAREEITDKHNQPLGEDDLADEYQNLHNLPVVGEMIEAAIEQNDARKEEEERNREPEPFELEKGEKVDAYLANQYTADQLQMDGECAVSVLETARSNAVRMLKRRNNMDSDFPWWDSAWFLDQLSTELAKTEAEMLEVVNENSGQAPDNFSEYVYTALMNYWRDKTGVTAGRSSGEADDLLPGTEDAFGDVKSKPAPRWPELEDLLLNSQNARALAEYARTVTKERWPQAEPIIFAEGTYPQQKEEQERAQNAYRTTFSDDVASFFTEEPAKGWTKEDETREEFNDDFFRGDSDFDKSLPESGGRGAGQGKLSEPWLSHPVQFGERHLLGGGVRALSVRDEDKQRHTGVFAWLQEGDIVTPLEMDPLKEGSIIVQMDEPKGRGTGETVDGRYSVHGRWFTDNATPLEPEMEQQLGGETAEEFHGEPSALYYVVHSPTGIQATVGQNATPDFGDVVIGPGEIFQAASQVTDSFQYLKIRTDNEMVNTEGRTVGYEGWINMKDLTDKASSTLADQIDIPEHAPPEEEGALVVQPEPEPEAVEASLRQVKTAEYWSDNPLDTSGQDADGQARAQDWMSRHELTATAGFQNTLMPVQKLLTVPGLRDEHTAIDWDNVRSIMQAAEDDPEKFFVEYRPKLEMHQDGSVFIFEGNHRVRAAAKLGLDSIPVDFDYQGGSEKLEGEWSPAAIR